MLPISLKIFCFLGNKMNNIDVIYTMWENLKKTASMDVGQVGFYNDKEVKSNQNVLSVANCFFLFIRFIVFFR